MRDAELPVDVETRSWLPPGTAMLVTEPTVEERRSMTGMSTEQRLLYLARMRRIIIARGLLVK
jgi:hypothetical protein